MTTPTPFVRVSSAAIWEDQVGYCRALPGKGPMLHNHDTNETFIAMTGTWRCSWENEKGKIEHVELKPLDGAPAELVTESPMQESYPAWSPDARSLVFLEQTPPVSSIHEIRRRPDGRWASAATRSSSGRSWTRTPGWAAGSAW